MHSPYIYILYTIYRLLSAWLASFISASLSERRSALSLSPSPSLSLSDHRPAEGAVVKTMITWEAQAV